MRGLRKTMPLEACQERSAAIIATLERHEAVVSARRVALFWPIEARHEVDLRVLDASLRARGIAVAYPAIDAETGMMTLRIAAIDELEERGYGFKEPASSTADASPLDVIVVPALAVDETGHRIGYGAGYYDRTLPVYAPPAITVAVAFDYQFIVEVPVTEGDVRVDWIVTDKRTIDTRSRG